MCLSESFIAPWFSFFATDTINSVGLKPLTDLLDLFGGWPMTLSSWDPASFDWTVAVSAARRIYGSGYFINAYNYLDSRNTSQSSIYVRIAFYSNAKGMGPH